MSATWSIYDPRIIAFLQKDGFRCEPTDEPDTYAVKRQENWTTITTSYAYQSLRNVLFICPDDFDVSDRLREYVKATIQQFERAGKSEVLALRYVSRKISDFTFDNAKEPTIEALPLETMQHLFDELIALAKTLPTIHDETAIMVLREHYHVLGRILLEKGL